MRRADTLRAVLVRPGEDAAPFEIEPGIAAMQRAVGGFIGSVALEGRAGERRLIAWVDDDGVLKGAPWNRQAGPSTYLAGPILVLAEEPPQGECASLTVAEQARVVATINAAWPKLSPSPQDLHPSSMDELERWLGHPPVEFFESKPGETFEETFARAFGGRS